MRSSRERIAWIVAGSLGAVAIAVLLLGYLGYLAPQAEPANLYRTSLELTALVTGELKKLFESNIRTVGFAGSNSHNYDVTPDGRRFLIAVTDGTTSQPPTTLLVNWTSALRP